VEKGRLRGAHKRRDNEINDKWIVQTSMFAYLISKLSKESLDKIQGYADWSKVDLSHKPLQLWMLINQVIRYSP
jgi:hypothetical protein